MIEFAVSVKDVTKEGQATWVLAVDPVGERMLIVHDDKSLHWHPMADCTFVKASTPDMPRAVIAVQPQQARAPLTLPMPNRAERRAINGN